MADSPVSRFEPSRIPGALWAEALTVGLARQLRAEWFGNPLHLILLNWPPITDFACAPRDFRPVNARRGRDVLAGRFAVGEEALSLGAASDPWNRASPSRRFATDLHRFAWLPHLLTQGEAGALEAVRLIHGWNEVFGRWNAFSWGAEVLEQRTFNLACALESVGGVLRDAEERQALAVILARHARQLAQTGQPRIRRAHRLAAAAVAAAALAGPAADRLLAGALRRLARAVDADVLADGGHASRSPQLGLELLFDLLTLDDALVQRGMERGPEVGGAIDRLMAALRFFTLEDGALACFQGGEAVPAAVVAAARAYDPDAVSAPAAAPHAGYMRLNGGGLEVMIDTGAPARGAFSIAACAQPLAIEVVAQGERLISNAGWSPAAVDHQAQRLTGAGSTAALGAASAGEPLSGMRARLLGPRLVGGARQVTARQHRTDKGSIIQATHDGWAELFGVRHERRLFLDPAASELRGEELLEPQGAPKGRLLAYALSFHLFPGVTASVARDRKSVLLRAPSQAGWWLRNDSAEVRVEPSIHFENGRPRATQQVVLRGHFRPEKGGRVRWKLTFADQGG